MKSEEIEQRRERDNKGEGSRDRKRKGSAGDETETCDDLKRRRI